MRLPDATAGSRELTCNTSIAANRWSCKLQWFSLNGVRSTQTMLVWLNGSKRQYKKSNVEITQYYFHAKLQTPPLTNLKIHTCHFSKTNLHFFKCFFIFVPSIIPVTVCALDSKAPSRSRVSSLLGLHRFIATDTEITRLAC